MGKLIKSRVPLRISFIGGGTDVSPFPEKYGGAAINAAINKYVSSTLGFRQDKKLNIEIIGEGKVVCPDIKNIKYDGEFDWVKIIVKNLYRGDRGLDIFVYKDVGPRSGLGGSAALFVSLIGIFNELNGEKLSKTQIAELAYRLERDELKNLGGKQDQYVSVFGGINYLEFGGGEKVKISPLDLPKTTSLEMEENLILFNLGERKDSGQIIESEIKNMESDEKTIQALLATKEMVAQVKEILLTSDLKGFGQALDRAWSLKRRFAEGISRPEIDRFYDNLKKAGSLGGKISGAGGGGHMFVFSEPFKRAEVEKEILKYKAEIVPFKFERQGLVVWQTKV